MHHRRDSSVYFLNVLIGCLAEIAQPMRLISLLLAASITAASSNGIMSQGSLSSSTGTFEDERPCDNSIPASAYALELLPRRTFHEGGDSCPSEYEMTTDENRIPAEMPEAKCKCVNCQLPLVLGRRQFKCFPIYHMVPVMRRVQNEAGQYGSWMYALERISVGCTCKRTRRCRRGQQIASSMVV